MVLKSLLKVKKSLNFFFTSLLEKILKMLSPVAYFFVALLMAVVALFFFSWVLQVTYNASIVQMAKNAVPLTYWHAMALLVFISVVGSFFIGVRGFASLSYNLNSSASRAMTTTLQ